MSERAIMPRAVTVALVAAAFLALLGVADMAIRLWGPVPPPLGVPSGMDLWWVFGAAYLFVGALRRAPRVRLPVFWVALGAAIVLGTFGAPLMLVLGVLDRSGFALAAGMVLVVPHAAIAYALSRPSAKAWFAPSAKA